MSKHHGPDSDKSIFADLKKDNENAIREFKAELNDLKKELSEKKENLKESRRKLEELLEKKTSLETLLKDKKEEKEKLKKQKEEKFVAELQREFEEFEQTLINSYELNDIKDKEIYLNLEGFLTIAETLITNRENNKNIEFAQDNIGAISESGVSDKVKSAINELTLERDKSVKKIKDDFIEEIKNKSENLSPEDKKEIEKQFELFYQNKGDLFETFSKKYIEELDKINEIGKVIEFYEKFDKTLENIFETKKEYDYFLEALGDTKKAKIDLQNTEGQIEKRRNDLVILENEIENKRLVFKNTEFHLKLAEQEKNKLLKAEQSLEDLSKQQKAPVKEQSNFQLFKQLEEKNKEINKLTEALNREREALKNLKTEPKINPLELELKKLKEEKEKSDKELREQKNEFQNLLSENQTKDKKINELSEELRAEEIKLRQLSKEKTSLEKRPSLNLEMEQKLATFGETEKALQSKIEILTREKEELAKKAETNAILQNRIEAEKKEKYLYDSLKDDLQKQKDTNEELRKKNQSLEDLNKESANKSQAQNLEISKLKKQNNELNQNLSEANKNKILAEQFERENNELKKALAEKELEQQKALEGKQKDIERLKFEQQTLVKGVLGKDEKNKLYEKENFDLKHQIDLLKKAAETRENNLKIQISETNDIKGELSKALLAKKEQEELVGQLKRDLSDKQNLEKALKDKDNILKEKEKKIEDLNNEIIATKKESTKSNQKQENDDNEIKKLRNELKIANEKNEKVLKENIHLNKELKEINNSLGNLNQLKKEFDEQKEQQNEILNQTKQTLEQKNKEIESLKKLQNQSNLKDIKNQTVNLALATENKKLKNQVKDLQEKNLTLEENNKIQAHFASEALRISKENQEKLSTKKEEPQIRIDEKQESKIVERLKQDENEPFAEDKIWGGDKGLGKEIRPSGASIDSLEEKDPILQAFRDFIKEERNIINDKSSKTIDFTGYSEEDRKAIIAVLNKDAKEFGEFESKKLKDLIYEKFKDNFKPVKFGDKNELELKNDNGSKVAGLKVTYSEKEYDADGGTKLKNYRTIDFPTKIEKDSGPYHMAFAARDLDGKPIKASDPAYFTAHYDKAGKLVEITAPGNLKFGTDPKSPGYFEKDGKIYTLPVTKEKYQEMAKEVAKNKGLYRDFLDEGLNKSYKRNVETDKLKSEVDNIKTNLIIKNKKSAEPRQRSASLSFQKSKGKSFP